jgi:hypothetical protein
MLAYFRRRLSVPVCVTEPTDAFTRMTIGWLTVLHIFVIVALCLGPLPGKRVQMVINDFMRMGLQSLLLLNHVHDALVESPCTPQC